MIVVLVGEAGQDALHKVTGATEIHAVGFVPDSSFKRPVAIHRDGEEAVAQRVKPDLLVGGTPALWGVEEAPETTPEITPEITTEPKRRGRPPRVKA